MQNFRQFLEGVSAEDVEYYFEVGANLKKEGLSKKEIKKKLIDMGAPKDIATDVSNR